MAFPAEDANLVENWITDINVALTVYGQSRAMVGVGQVNGTPEMEGGIEDLDAGVAYVEHEQFTFSHDRLGG